MPDRPRALCPGCNEPVPVVNEAYWPHYATQIAQVPPLQVITDLWPCEGSGLPLRACRMCGCTELDCRGCIEKTGKPCSWVEDDLCSACVGKEVNLEDYMPDERHQRLHRFGQDLDPRDLPNPTIGPAIDEFRNEVLGEFRDREDGDDDRRRR